MNISSPTFVIRRINLCLQKIKSKKTSKKRLILAVLPPMGKLKRFERDATAALTY